MNEELPLRVPGRSVVSDLRSFPWELGLTAKDEAAGNTFAGGRTDEGESLGNAGLDDFRAVHRHHFRS